MKIRNIVLVLAATLLGTGFVAAQKLVPIDKNLKKGKLANGMTYYVRYNNELPGHADFHIFHVVGAIQEENNQNGLAHFLEHMAFKGLKSLPGNQLLDYMESNGVKFGPNLNAATSYDYTHYMLRQIPIARKGMVDTCMQVLSDWSGGITATQEAIDFERGVIREEYRSRSDLQSRITAAMEPYYFKDSKYAERNIIGDMNIIANFKRDEILDFYHTWYRPDLQAIVVIGDIDVDKVEKEIIAKFSKLPNPANARQKDVIRLPGNKQPIVAKYADSEVGDPSVSILFKHTKNNNYHAGSLENYLDDYINKLVVSMMNNRWQAISQNDGWWVKNVGFNYGDFVADQNVFAIGAELKKDPENWATALDQVLSEAERFRRLGFNADELSAVKGEYTKQLERFKSESVKIPTNRLIQSYLQNFLTGHPIPAVDYQYNVYKQVLDTLTLATVNGKVKQFFKNEDQIVALISSVKDSAAMLSKQYVVDKLSEMHTLTVQPYKGPETKPLTPKYVIKGGKVVATQKSILGATKWTLSNGVEVTILPTKYKQDEVLMTGVRMGGRSTVADNALQSSYMLTSQMSNAGVGELDAIALRNTLRKHIVYVTPFMGEFDEGLSCTSSPRDFEEMLKLIYMQLTEQRFDPKILKRDLDSFSENMANRPLNPMAAMQDSVFLTRYNHHARSLVYIQDTSAVKLPQIEELYKTHFGNPVGFQWIITGNADLNTIKPLVEKYLGGLAGKPQAKTWKDLDKRSPKGVVNVDFEAKMESPKSITFIEYTKEQPFSLKNLIGIRMLKNVLDVRLKVLLRDDKSGVYTTDGEGSITELPVSQLYFLLSFQADPERMDELTTVAIQELERLAHEGVTPEDVVKSQEYMKKTYQNQLENNYYWQGLLYGYLQTGRDKHTQVLETIDQITAADITALLKELVDANNRIKVTMRPKAAAVGVQFEDNLSWNAILEKAKKENKHIFVDCYTTWCGPCKEMTQNVFPQKVMGDFFNPTFVNVKVQMDRTAKDSDYIQSWYATTDSLAKLYAVKSYPTFLIFNPEGKLVHRLVSGDAAEKFIAKVKLGLDPKTAYYALEERFNGGDRSLALLRDLTLAYKNTYNAAKEAEVMALYFKSRKGAVTEADLQYAIAYGKGTKSDAFSLVNKNRQQAEAYLDAQEVNKFLAGNIMADEVYTHFQTGMDAPVAPILNKAQKKYPEVPLEKEGLRLTIRQLKFKKDEVALQQAIATFNRLYPQDSL